MKAAKKEKDYLSQQALLDYYELKAVDAYESNTPMKVKAALTEEEKEKISEEENMLDNIRRVEKELKQRKRQQKRFNQNMDDSREEDFEGFDDI